MYEQIPEELKALPQWVCAGSASKCPMRVYGGVAASSSDPSTWTDFQTALWAVDTGLYEYLGFVFADNGIVGIDIDAGFEDGHITDLCMDIMSACMSYTEYSKSGRGVHIFVKGTLPFSGRNNRKGVEIYQSKRFFITTGRVLGFRHMIENQTGIDYVVAKYFSEEEREGQEVPRSSRIYSANWQKPAEGINLAPQYTKILPGSRNLSLLSIAGQLWSAGYDKKALTAELLKVNREACDPPLSESEVRSVVRSVLRYKR